MIERYLLRYFVAVIDHGSFSRAAISCGVSQPTLSVGIARLESEIGQTLLLRSNRRVELTGAGVRLADHARRIEREFTLAEQASLAVATAVTVRLGILATIPSGAVQAAIATAVATTPEERIEIIFGSERRLIGQLAKGRLDAVLGIVRPDRARLCEPLIEEGYRLAMAPNHPLANQRRVEPEDIADNAMIVRRHCEILGETSRHFTARGVRPFMSARVTSDEQALACVRTGLGITVMPASFAAHDIAMPQLGGFDATRTIGVIHDRPPQDRRRSRALDVIAATLREGMARSVGLAASP